MDSRSDVDHVTEHHHFDRKEVRQHAGPWLIAIGVVIKSLLALAIAAGLEIWGAGRMHDWIGLQIERHHLNPEHGFFATLMGWISTGNVHKVAAALVFYAILHGLEAWGLWKDKPWASWGGCMIAAAYLPLDVTAMFTHPNWITLGIVLINVGVVLVLGWNIRRLQRRKLAAIA